MAEEIEEQVEEEEEKPSGKSPFKWMIIGVAFLLVVGGGYVGWTMIRNGSDEPSQSQDPAAESSSTSIPETALGQTFDMDPFVVNLNEPGGKRYLKAKVGLEFVEEEVRLELTARTHQLRDVILLHLTSKSLEDIQSVDGKIELKKALIQRINQVIKKGKVRNIFFTQFVIQ